MARGNSLKAFIDSEAASALPLLAAAVLAMVVANSPWAPGMKELLLAKLGFAWDRSASTSPCCSGSTTG